MDSVLLVAASTGYKNLVQPALSTRRTEARRQVQWTRLMVIALAIIAAGLALEPPGDILQITIFSGSLYAVCFAGSSLRALLVQRKFNGGLGVDGSGHNDTDRLADYWI